VSYCNRAAGFQKSFPTSKRATIRMRACSATVQEDPSTSFSLPTLKILYNDGAYVVVDKPRGMYVHPPEDRNRLIPKHENGMYLLKQQLGGDYYIYPLHRIDRATSGVVVYALSSKAASEFGTAMRARAVHKVYYAFVRGYTDTTGVIDDGMGGQEAVTLYETIMRVNLPMQVGRNQFPTQRYSLVRAVPLTGRYHQIRRHFNYISHPIVGDGDHGDRFHNRKFANDLDIPGMFLRAASISFKTLSGQTISVASPASEWEPRWQAIFSAAGACPLVSGASLLPPPSQLATLYHEGEDQDVEGSSKADTRNQQETGFACLRGWQPGFCEPLPLLGELPSLKLDGSCS